MEYNSASKAVLEIKIHQGIPEISKISHRNPLSLEIPNISFVWN
jgi:hypothetical protein